MSEAIDPLILSFNRSLRLFPWDCPRERWAAREERREELVRMAAELVSLGVGETARAIWDQHAPEGEPVIGPLRFL